MNGLRLTDLLALSGRSLAQHKGRTLLTLLGVILGAFLLVVSLSVGQGVGIAVKRTLSFGGRLKVITIRPDHKVDPDKIPAEDLEVAGDFDEATRERLRQKLIEEWQGQHGYQPNIPITESDLRDVETWDHIAQVDPEISLPSQARLNGVSEYCQVTARSGEDGFLKQLIVRGSPDADDGRGILIHEFLAYRLGFQSDAELQSIVGRTIELEFSSYLYRGVLDLLKAQYTAANKEKAPEQELQKYRQALEELSATVDRLPLSDEQKAALKSTLNPESAPADSRDKYRFVEEFTIAGIYRSPTDEELETNWYEYRLRYSEVILPIFSGRALCQKIPEHRKRGYESARIVADDEINVRSLSERLRQKGFGVNSSVDFIEAVQKHVAVITTVMATIAAVALLVAALGISNVMAMSVLERTHEIGIMKAVGARERTIRAIFLLEGSLVGLTGGVIGVVLGILAQIPGNAIARWVMEQRGFQENLEGTLFAYPLWIVAGVPAFAASMTMIAAYVPARRASRIDPIEALRHD